MQDFIQHIGEGFIGSILILIVYIWDKWKQNKKHDSELIKMQGDITANVIDQIKEVHSEKLKLKDQELDMLNNKLKDATLKIELLGKKIEELLSEIKDQKQEIKVQKKVIELKTEEIKKLQNER